MRYRLLLAAVALAGSLAFAPAPFPRPRRDPAGTDLDRLQGTWKVLSLQQIAPGGKRTPVRWGVTAAGVTHIRIRKDVWTYLERQPGKTHENTSYAITVGPGKKACKIEFRFPKAPRVIAAGIIRRDRDRVEVLWYSGNAYPHSFDKPPVNFWIMLLQRDT